MRATLNRTVAGIGQEFATYLSAIIIIVFGGWRVMEGAITVGTLAAFYSYVLAMWSPIRWMTFINQMAQQAMAAAERVFEILDTPLEVTERPGAIVLPRLQGHVAFDHVWFAYGRNPPLLRDVSFVVEPGQTVALVGPSGSGKTTVVNLLPRFYDVTSGAVRVDGHDVRAVTLASLRSQIGMVMQEPFLFNLSIRENIRYGRPEATQAEIEAAARVAAAHEFILALPQGYDTLVGERGVRLSGGQRQRLAIARAILVDPRLLILDEATSSVDTQTEQVIRQALDQLLVGRTTIVIAHRLSTVQRAHQILVMERGQITARGTHQELLRTSPLYQHLCEIQFQLQAGAPAPPELALSGPSPNGQDGQVARSSSVASGAEVRP
jgi:ABC-type multidrug transport system fused ATPase/permease subunit